MTIHVARLGEDAGRTGSQLLQSLVTVRVAHLPPGLAAVGSTVCGEPELKSYTV
jgi:hypothetical protein